MEQRAICILHQHVACQLQLLLLLLLFVSCELLHAPMRQRVEREGETDEAAAKDAQGDEGDAALCELQRVQ